MTTLSSDVAEPIWGSARARTAATWVVVAATVLYLSGLAALLATVVQEYRLVQGLTLISQGTAGRAQLLVERQLVVTVLLWPTTLLYVASNIVLLAVIRRTARRQGGLPRRWSLAACTVALVASAVLPFVQGPVTPLDSWTAARVFAPDINTRTMSVVSAQIALACVLSAIVWFERATTRKLVTTG